MTRSSYEKYLRGKGYCIEGNHAVLCGTKLMICEGIRNTAIGPQKSFWLERVRKK